MLATDKLLRLALQRVFIPGACLDIRRLQLGDGVNTVGWTSRNDAYSIQFLNLANRSLGYIVTYATGQQQQSGQYKRGGGNRGNHNGIYLP